MKQHCGHLIGLLMLLLTKDKESIATLLKTGLHRTESEMDRKNNAYQWAGGLRVGWKRNGFGVGLTTAFHRI